MVYFKTRKDVSPLLNTNTAGLAYSNETVENLVNKDTDKDSIPDWQEKLWGTDPTKKETTQGVPDAVAIDKLKATQGIGEGKILDQGTTGDPQTDKFSKELFSTVTTLSQNGEINQANIDKMSSSLSNEIQNSAPKKTFTIANIKIAKNDTRASIQKYSDALDTIYSAKPPKQTVIDVLQKLGTDENNIDKNVLAELDPIIEYTNKIIDAMQKTPTPESLTSAHLNVLNRFENLIENLNNIKLFNTNIIVAMGAVSNYSQNTQALESSVNNLFKLLTKKLNQ